MAESKRRPGRPRAYPPKSRITLALRPSTLEMIDAVKDERAIDSISGAIDQLIISHPWCRKHRTTEPIDTGAES